MKEVKRKYERIEQYRIGREVADILYNPDCMIDFNKWRKKNYPDIDRNRLYDWSILPRFGTYEQCLEAGFTNIIRKRLDLQENKK